MRFFLAHRNLYLALKRGRCVQINRRSAEEGGKAVLEVIFSWPAGLALCI